MSKSERYLSVQDGVMTVDREALKREERRDAENTWFVVDKDGLRKLIEKRGKTFAIQELIQNAWDTRAEKVTVTLTPVPGRPYADLTVEDDDPEGFLDLSHAFTLFAESHKKNDPTKRGRFNLGEKLVLALCEEAEIRSVKGAVGFDAKGRWSNNSPSARRKFGTLVTMRIRMTRDEYAEVCKEIPLLLPPPNLITTFNGQRIESREPLGSIRLQLPTEIADDEGVMRKTRRMTDVRIFEPKAGEVATLFEMGIPVVETGDKWHIDIGQKVPLNVDRDNVTPAYLRELRVSVLNEMHRFLASSDLTETWVREGAEDERCTGDAIQSVVTGLFGEKRVAYDPSDPEANKRATAAGYTVVPGGSMSSGMWKNAKTAGAISPASHVTPSPKPYGNSPDLESLKLVSEMTEGMTKVENYAQDIAYKLIKRHVRVLFANDAHWPYAATYGRSGNLVLNVGRLGKAWFDKIGTHTDDLLLHEFGHEYAEDHLSSKYHDALTDLGARFVQLALEEPDLLRRYRG